MNANTIELILKILEVAGPIIAQVPKLGAKWITNRNEVLAMVREGRDPTPEEHARLARELDSLVGGLRTALATAEMQALASAPAPAEVADVVEAAVPVADETVDDTPAEVDERVEAAVSVAAEAADDEAATEGEIVDADN